MHTLAGSPFAPDAASDWANVIINALIGLATLAALALTIRQSRQASRDSMAAQTAARQSEARERARESAARLKAIEQRASRQATAVTVAAAINFDGQHSHVAVDIRNDSDAAIRDITVTSTAGGETFTWPLSSVGPHGQQRTNQTHIVPESLVEPVEANLVIDLTDVYMDRWRIHPSGKVELLESARIVDTRASDAAPAN
ncbi:hypothetical protein ABRP24_009645 [Curtobacterium sp. WHRI 8282]|uniref:hypothetical protein n=1 Tax=Curtobacterium sp. WHRI 8282 TaxID=3162559 RepID=UPI0032EF46EC